MADAWGRTWSVSWGISWGSGVTPVTSFSGGYEYYARNSRRRTEEEIRADRERWGIIPAAANIIAEVAIRQADSLDPSAERRLAELESELDAQGIEFQGRHLELLNIQRQRLIDGEIKSYFEAQQALDEENSKRLLLLMALA